MSERYYIVTRHAGLTRAVLTGPRGSASVGADSGPEPTDVLSDVPSWVHRDRVGARKRGLEGWKTLAGLLRSKAWRDRVAEERLGCSVSVVRPVERIGEADSYAHMRGEPYDALEPVATQKVAGGVAQAQQDRQVGEDPTLVDPED